MGTGWLAAMFAVWVLGGGLVARSIPTIRATLGRQPRTIRAVLGVGLLLTSAAILLGGLAFLSSSRPSPADFSWLDSAMVTAGGLIFVVLQALTAAILISLADSAVTNRRSQPSINQNPEGTDS